MSCGPIHSEPVERTVRGTQCGPEIEFEPINLYSGDRPWVQAREEAVALINANCTGTYIRVGDFDRPLVLTAGHCGQLGDPMSVIFNFEINPDGDTLQTQGTIIERADAPDYALIELNDVPPITPTELGVWVTRRLFAIQHPLGQTKVIDDGVLAKHTESEIHYTDLDTLEGSSGAGLFNEAGRLVGIHTLGECTVSGGTNGGWTLSSVIEASALLSAEVGDDC